MMKQTNSDPIVVNILIYRETTTVLLSIVNMQGTCQKGHVFMCLHVFNAFGVVGWLIKYIISNGSFFTVLQLGIPLRQNSHAATKVTTSVTATAVLATEI